MDRQHCSLTVLVLMLASMLMGCIGDGNQGGGGAGKGAPGFLVFPDLTIRTQAQGPPSTGLYLEGSIIPGKGQGPSSEDGFMPRGDVLGTGDLTPGGHYFLTFPSLDIDGEHVGHEILPPNLRGSRQGNGFNPTERKVTY